MTGGQANNLVTRVDGVPIAPLLAAVHKQCFDTAWNEAAMAGLLASPGVFALIGRGEPDEPVGFALARAAGPELEILTLCVVPAARRHGAGHRLLRALIREGQRLDLAEIFLEVAQDNKPARALYAAHDFVQTGTRPGYYKKTADTAAVTGLTMSRVLSKP